MEIKEKQDVSTDQDNKHGNPPKEIRNLEEREIRKNKHTLLGELEGQENNMLFPKSKIN